MSDIDEAGRALIALADDAHDPTDVDRARVRAALSGRLGAAAGLGFGTVAGLGATAKAAVGAGGAASAGGAGAAVAGGTLATKLVGVAVAITTVVGVGASVKLALRSAQVPAAPKTSEAARRRAAVAAPPALPAPAREQAASASPAPVPPAADPAPRHVAAKNEAPKDEASKHEAPQAEAPRAEALNNAAPFVPTAPPPLPERPVPAAIDTRDPAGAGPQPRATTATGARDQTCAPARRSESAVADEARLVHDGVSALRAGQAACALSLLETHARFYPEGVLAEEREAERAIALADIGRVAEARLAAAAFLRSHPTSPLGVRLRHRIPGIEGADGAR